MIKQALHIFKNMGMRYTLYRILHEVEKRIGVLKKRHPISPPSRFFISLSEWRKKCSSLSQLTSSLGIVPNSALSEEVDKISRGNVLYFCKEWKDLGLNYDWITNPINNYRYDALKHWSEIADYSSESGDIKYVWEKSRFSFLLTIIRNDYHNQEDHSELVFSEINSWIDANPINQGPNWRCSQEISLRILNWYFALNYYRNSEFLSEELWRKIQNVIYWSLHHVYGHINFSRIAVRNNHALTETLFLTLSKYLFPFIPETNLWSKKGRIWFEKEIAYQIYDDGTFLQFSMNYHRVVVQLLSLGIGITNQKGDPFAPHVKDKAYKSLNFLYQCMVNGPGQLPNYGANDGALFFPLSDLDYTDFRPQINALHRVLTGVHLFSEETIQEEALWLEMICNRYDSFPAINKNEGLDSFEESGYYLMRDDDSLTFIKCGRYKDRPSQADNLHIDIWVGQENLLCDGGSFLYNTDEQTIRYFMGTKSHNTVMLDENDQMLKGSRFIWYYWSQATEINFTETTNEYRFRGKVKCFSQINKAIIHEREVIKKKGQLAWKITDTIHNKPASLKLRQLWHTPDLMAVKFESDGTKEIKVGYRSIYYGTKEEISQVEFTTFDDKVTTIIRIIRQ